jgi:hypothetical protein
MGSSNLLRRFPAAARCPEWGRARGLVAVDGYVDDDVAATQGGSRCTTGVWGTR